MRRGLAIGAAVAGALVARATIRRLTRYDIRDKVVVITGGSRGLGLVMARELLALGASVAICARDADELARAKAELDPRGRVLALTCDVTDRTDVARFVSAVRDELGHVDVLINNAGIIGVGPMEHMTGDDFERAMATHFWGPLNVTLEVLPAMHERGEGRIVNITSIGGKVAMPHLLPYTASKFALVGLSEGMRAELAKAGIVVTTVVPGLMRTGSPVNAVFKGHHRDEYAWFAIVGSLPLLSMRPERAAKQIISAMLHGDPQVVPSMPAKLAVAAHAIAPGLVQRVLGLVNRVLPKGGGVGSQGLRGRESSSRWVPQTVTRIVDRAARDHNELSIDRTSADETVASPESIVGRSPRPIIERRDD